MPLDIFETDPDARGEQRDTYTPTHIGQFAFGTNEGGQLGTLPEWRVVTGSPDVADAIAQLLGGQAEDFETPKDFNIRVDTATDSVPIILADTDAIYADMKLWVNGKLKHHCTGAVYLSAQNDSQTVGKPCGCPKSFDERKALAADDEGPSPSIDIKFRLAADPELGEFLFHTGSWTLVKVLWKAQNDLAEIGGEAVTDLKIKYTEFKSKKTNKTVSYRSPELGKIRSYNAAIAE